MMHSGNAAVLVILVKLCCGVSYSDLKVMGAVCSPLDSCERDRSASLPLEFNDANCFCDERCEEYADCCLSAQYNVSRYKDNLESHSCIQLQEYGNIYMTGTCGDGWQDEEVSRLCVNGSPKSSGRRRDPLGNLPATSLDTSVTYANYYCAICNRDTQSLRVWSARWECSTLLKHSKNFTREDLVSNLVYSGSEWGVNFDNNGTIEFHRCFIYPVIPKEVRSATRKCFEAVMTCAEGWKEASVADLCRSYTAVVYTRNDSFKNLHCAICNNVTREETTCLKGLSDRTRTDEFFNFKAFALLLDFTDSSGSNVVGSTSTCQESEIWDPFFRKCRSVMCAKQNHVLKHGKCIPASDLNAAISTEPNTLPPPTSAATDGVGELPTTTHSSIAAGRDNNAIVFPGESFRSTQVHTTTVITPSSTTSTISNTAMSSNESAEFLNCNRISLSEEEFSVLENGTVFVEAYGRSYDMEEYEVSEDGILLCSPLTPTDKFSQAMGWVSLAGLGLSCVCLLLHLAVFLLVPDFRNLSGKNLASLCLALVASYATFIANVFVKPDQTGCVILAAAMYYFFLSSFTWMSTAAFDIWYTFRRTKTELRVTGGKQRYKFLAYCLYSWFLPAVAVMVLVLVDRLEPSGVPEEYLPSLGKRWCWFGHRKALLVFFAIPMVAIIIVNSAFFISSAKIIAETTHTASSMTDASHHKNQYKMYLRLAVLMGFTWLSGIVAGYLQLEAAWYVFVLLNTLQGVFIFLAFTFRRKVWRAVGGRCRRLLERGASWVGGRHHPGRQTLELGDASDLHSSSSPITSHEG
ncbi:uncharacterized protein [Panulirus ornatus]|uniref:uncharacterized protein n=1 Tax=Panulirus ornatus TaxID=150431 RepID=UPI003A87F8B0